MDASIFAQKLVDRLVAAEPAAEMYDKQHQFVYSDAHHLAFIAGIGSGKSWAGAMRSIRAAKGRIGGGAVPVPNLGVVTAPTYDMLRDATLRAFYDVAGDDIEHLNKQEMKMTLTNGSEILFRSTSHPERLRGPSIAWWYADESALSPAVTRKIMLGRLRQFGQRGYEWHTTTPRGRNWVWRTFIRDGAARDDYAVVRAISRENRFLDVSIMEAWESEYTGDFARQELLGEFVAFEGLIYVEFSRERHVVRDMPEQFKRVVAGVDWGFANPGVIVVVGLDGDGRAWLVHEEYARQRRVEEWASVAVQLRGTYPISEWFCDPSEPDNIRVFRDAGLGGVQRADNTVLTGIQRVKNRLVIPPDGKHLPRLIVAERCVHTIDEMEQYQWAQNQHGLRDAPVKANDHAMDALRYAIMGLDGGRGPIKATSRSYIG